MNKRTLWVPAVLAGLSLGIGARYVTHDNDTENRAPVDMGVVAPAQDARIRKERIEESVRKVGDRAYRIIACGYGTSSDPSQLPDNIERVIDLIQSQIDQYATGRIEVDMTSSVHIQTKGDCFAFDFDREKHEEGIRDLGNERYDLTVCLRDDREYSPDEMENLIGERASYLIGRFLGDGMSGHYTARVLENKGYCVILRLSPKTIDDTVGGRNLDEVGR